MIAGLGALSRLPYGARVALAVVAECGYLAARTLITREYADLIEREIAVSLARVASAVFLLFLFPELLRRSPGRRGLPAHPLLLAVLAAFFLAMPLAGFVMGYELRVGLVYAVTSPIVGVREELFYRGILQDSLARAVGPVLGVAGASVLFVLYHIGSQPLHVYSVTLIFAAGVLFGVIYYRTQNLVLVMGLHAAYDIVVVLVPGMRVIEPGWALISNVAVLLGAVVWAKMDSERKGTP